MNLKLAKELGYEVGKRNASHVAVPEIGTVIPRDIDYLGLGIVTYENLSEVWEMYVNESVREDESRELDPNFLMVVSSNLYRCVYMIGKDTHLEAYNNGKAIGIRKVYETLDFTSIYVLTHGQRTKALAEFQDAYIEAMLWADGKDTDDDGNEVDLSDYDFSKEAKALIEIDCDVFLDEAWPLIQSCNYKGKGSKTCTSLANAGHDFWLSRNGHGVGFWDGDWLNGEQLTTMVEGFKPLNPYLGDDGLVYLA